MRLKYHIPTCHLKGWRSHFNVSFQQKAASDVLQRQCDMGSEPDRRMLLEDLFAFMEERGTPIQTMPTVSKNFIDLYLLYTVVKAKGGLVEVHTPIPPQAGTLWCLIIVYLFA